MTSGCSVSYTSSTGTPLIVCSVVPIVVVVAAASRKI
jgi:hypothetical protein